MGVRGGLHGRHTAAAVHASSLSLVRLGAVCRAGPPPSHTRSVPHIPPPRPPHTLAKVLCAKYTDEEYKARRCPPAEFESRWAVHGVTRVWRDDVLPCRVYLRHCVLAARGFCPEAHNNFLDATFLADRVTTMRTYLQLKPEILDEQPPPELLARYSG